MRWRGELPLSRIDQVFVAARDGFKYRCFQRISQLFECGYCREPLPEIRPGFECARCGSRVAVWGASWNDPLRTTTREHVAALETRCDGQEHCAATHVHALEPSDTGITGAIPLPPDEWHPAVTDEGWSEQNRKINELLMGRAG